MPVHGQPADPVHDLVVAGAVGVDRRHRPLAALRHAPAGGALEDEDDLREGQGCGDQPGVQMNLYRFVRSIGLTPLLCGNIKGLQDPYRNPTTQKGFAERWGQNPYMVTSFADGTKISFEQAVVANATGMTVAKRGMHGYSFEPGTPITVAAKSYDADEILAGPGIVDYVVGCEPGPGVWALGTIEHPRQRHYLNLYKLGEGPLYCFHTPYHLCHFEVPVTIARAALLHDAAITPIGAPATDSVCTFSGCSAAKMVPSQPPWQSPTRLTLPPSRSTASPTTARWSSTVAFLVSWVAPRQSSAATRPNPAAWMIWIWLWPGAKSTMHES